MKIGVIGLGAMGSRVAANILSDGHELFIYNRTRSKTNELANKGAIVCEAAHDLVRKSDLIFSFLTNDEAVNDVWLSEKGAAKALDDAKIVIESSTLSSEMTAKLRREFIQYNLLIAPVVGSRPQAEKRELVFLIGGDKKNYEKVRSLIDSLANKTIYFDNPLKANALKLTINSLFGIQTIAFAEFYTALQRNEFTQEEVSTLLSQLPVTAPVMRMMIELFDKEMYSPLFPLNLVEKDFRYASQFLAISNINSYITEAAQKTYKMAIDHNLGEQNISGIINLIKGRRSGKGD